MAHVETPGGAHTSTAIILFGKAWQRLATLSIDCFLKASSNWSILIVVLSGVAMPIPTGLWMPAVMLTGVFMCIPRLGALLHRVSPIAEGRSLPRLHPSYLVDMDFGVCRVLNVDVHQGWVERHLLIGQR